MGKPHRHGSFRTRKRLSEIGAAGARGSTCLVTDSATTQKMCCSDSAAVGVVHSGHLVIPPGNWKSNIYIHGYIMDINDHPPFISIYHVWIMSFSRIGWFYMTSIQISWCAVSRLASASIQKHRCASIAQRVTDNIDAEFFNSLIRRTLTKLFVDCSKVITNTQPAITSILFIAGQWLVQNDWEESITTGQLLGWSSITHTHT